jgi:hypothetical protein
MNELKKQQTIHTLKRRSIKRIIMVISRRRIPSFEKQITKKRNNRLLLCALTIIIIMSLFPSTKNHARFSDL